MSDIIKVDVERLPKPRNDAAATVSEHINRTFMALPAHVDPQSFAHACVIAANELKRDCDPASVMTAALNCAKMGLLPGESLGLAYFVPFKNKDTQKTEAQLVVGYRGYLDLAYGSGFLKSVHCDVVLRGETFEQWNDENGAHFKHPKPLERYATRENIVSAYCWGTLTTGGTFFVPVPKQDIESVRNDRSPAWKYRYSEMALKTAIRRAAKMWKLNGAMATALQHDASMRGPDFDDLEPHPTATARVGSLLETAPEPEQHDAPPEIHDTNEFSDDEKAAILAAEASEQQSFLG